MPEHAISSLVNFQWTIADVPVVELTRRSVGNSFGSAGTAITYNLYTIKAV